MKISIQHAGHFADDSVPAVPPEFQKDLLLVFIPVKESFEILKIHTPPSAIQGGGHYVINATPTDVAIKFGAAKPVLIH